jgi:rod shape-determining protein MreD
VIAAARPNRLWVLALTFIVALMLATMPLPAWASLWRPVWVAMVLVYWCIALPNRVGIATGWFVGLLVDVLTSALLGQNALGLALVAYFALKLHQRIRVYPLGQQAVVVGILLIGYLALMQLVTTLVHASTGYGFWLPAVTSMLLWPWLFVILRDVRRRANVS